MTLESRVILITLGAGLLFLIHIPAIKSRLMVIPGIKIFMYFLYFIVSAWGFEIFEYFSEDHSISMTKNFLYTGSSLMLVFWIIRITKSRVG